MNWCKVVVMRKALRRTCIISLVSMLSLGIGCNDDDEYHPALCSDFEPAPLPDIPLAYSTEHLDIHVEEGRLLCAGTAREYENHFQYVTDELGVTRTQRIPVFIMSSVKDHCPELTAGCIKRSGAAYATIGTTHHELAHAAACDLRSGSAPALSEGLAKSFEVTSLSAKFDPTQFLVATRSREVNYDEAGHFVRWLLETRSLDAFQETYETALRKGGEGIFDVLELSYDQDVDALFADYEASAPHMWVPHRQCADLEVLEPQQEGVWEFDAMFDCEDDSTYGPDELAGDDTHCSYLADNTIYQSFLLEIDAPGSYRFLREIETSVEIERCVPQAGLSEEEAAEIWHSDWLFAGVQGITDVELMAGTYRVDVLRHFVEPHDAPQEVWLQIEPTPG